MATLADTLVQRIRDADPSVIEELRSIDNPCIEDSERCTLLAAAIRCGNDDALDALLSHDSVVEYFPALPAEQKHVVKQSGSFMSSDDIGETEAYVSGPFGGLSNFERSPLLEACRAGNRHAMQRLVAAGARGDARDVLGETALSLCAYHDTELLAFAANCLADAGLPFDVDEVLLEKAVPDSDAMDVLVNHGRLDSGAQDLLFCVHCARLDLDGIARQLNDGYELKRKRPIHRDPLLEALSSDLLIQLGLPDRNTLAAGPARVYEKSDGEASTSLEGLVSDLFNELELADTDTPAAEPDHGDEPGNGEAPGMPAAQRDTRLALVDELLEHGLNPRQGNPRDAMAFLDRIITWNEPVLLDKVAALGIQFDKHQLDWDNRIEFALRHRCFAAIAALPALGVKSPKEAGAVYDEYLAWCEQNGVTPVALARGGKQARQKPATPPPAPGIDHVPGFRALRNALASWETVGESLLQAARVETDDGPLLRLTYSNVYGPVDGIELAVRYRRNPWKEAALVEEIVDVDGNTVLRSEAGKLVGETPWDATFEVDYPLPKGEFVMDIQLSSPAEGIDPPQVIDDWVVTVDRKR